MPPTSLAPPILSQNKSLAQASTVNPFFSLFFSLKTCKDYASFCVISFIFIGWFTLAPAFIPCNSIFGASINQPSFFFFSFSNPIIHQTPVYVQMFIHFHPLLSPCTTHLLISLHSLLDLSNLIWSSSNCISTQLYIISTYLSIHFFNFSSPSPLRQSSPPQIIIPGASLNNHSPNH